MAIDILERAGSQAFFRSLHVIAYSLGDNRHVIVRSGIVVLPNESERDAAAAGRPWTPSGFRGRSRDQWRGDTVNVHLDLAPAIGRLHPPAPEPGRFWRFEADQWAPIASLNSVYNDQVSNDAGTSVDTFALVQNDASTFVTLALSAGVRDTDGYLYRIGYHLTMVGRLVQGDTVG